MFTFHMKEDVYLVSENLNPLSPNQAQGIRKMIPAPPEGYEEYLCNYGTGTFCDEIVIWPPKKVTEMLKEFRPLLLDSVEIFRDYGPVPNLRYHEMIPFAHSHCGDHFVVMPSDTTQIFMIPRHDDAVYSLPEGFHDLLNWERSHHQNQYLHPYECSSEFLYFETDYNRAGTNLFTAASFDLQEVAQQLTQMLDDQEIRRTEEADAVFLFSRVIQGRIQLTQPEGDPRVGVDITCDRSCCNIVAFIIERLESMGFYLLSPLKNR